MNSAARIALYDDMLSSPRIIEVKPAETGEFIGKLSAEIYNQAQQLGGSIPYTIISQVAENFIHASFKEMVISIFDSGNTIRFTDQGPGISDKEKAQQPGYSSATREMKAFINGVGSGLPIVREYLDTKHGTIHIEDNLNSGAVVTISLVEEESYDQKSHEQNMYDQNIQPDAPLNQNVDTHTGLTHESFAEPMTHVDEMINIPLQQPIHNPFEMDYRYTLTKGQNIDQGNPSIINPLNSQRSLQLIISSLSKRELSILYLFKNNDVWGITEIAKETGIPASSTSNLLSKLEQMGILIKVGKKRALTELGDYILKTL